MDPTVPRGAALLLDFIRETETGRRDRTAYDTIYGHNEDELDLPVTRMTLDQVIASGPIWTRAYGSSAAGAYQFMRATLKDLVRELGLRGGQVLGANLQDRLAYHLLKRRGYAEFIAGKINSVEFAKRLAMEWASFPVLAATKGAHRQISRGQSYYAGDGLNKALIDPEQVDAILSRVLDATVAPHQPAEPAPAPMPAEPAERPTAPVLVIAIIILVTLAAAAWLILAN